MTLKTKLVRSIIKQPDGSVRINLTAKNGESYTLLDTIVINNFEKMWAEAQVHYIDLIPRPAE